MQLGIEDYIYAVGMSRVRHFYVETVPQAERYFVGSIHDDFATVLAPTVFGMPVTPARQSLLTVPRAIATVNGVIVGSFAGLLVRAFIAESLVLTKRPFLNSRESSPMYQTFPNLSWAYQSKVRSIGLPRDETVSRTTTLDTPRMTFV